jgi:hypothetical protein
LFDAHVFHTPCAYDAILGRDILQEMGVRLDFSSMMMMWDDCHVPMRTFNKTAVGDTPLSQQLFHDLLEDDLEDPLKESYQISRDETANDQMNDESSRDSDQGNDHAVYAASNEGCKSQKIKSSKYEGADISDVVRKCSHLSQEKQNNLYNVLSKYPTLFDADLKCYTGGKIHLDLDTNAPPSRTRAYTVPCAHHEVFKTELDRLIRIGVLA